MKQFLEHFKPLFKDKLITSECVKALFIGLSQTIGLHSMADGTIAEVLARPRTQGNFIHADSTRITQHAYRKSLMVWGVSGLNTLLTTF